MGGTSSLIDFANLEVQTFGQVQHFGDFDVRSFRQDTLWTHGKC